MVSTLWAPEKKKHLFPFKESKTLSAKKSIHTFTKETNSWDVKTSSNKEKTSKSWISNAIIVVHARARCNKAIDWQFNKCYTSPHVSLSVMHICHNFAHPSGRTKGSPATKKKRDSKGVAEQICKDLNGESGSEFFFL
jgi:hypothetical protein